MTVKFELKRPVEFKFKIKHLAYLEELSGVVITVVDSNLASIDADVETDVEVLGQEGGLGAVLLENHLALEEGTLEGSTVGLAGLSDHD